MIAVTRYCTPLLFLILSTLITSLTVSSAEAKKRLDAEKTPIQKNLPRTTSASVLALDLDDVRPKTSPVLEVKGQRPYLVPLQIPIDRGYAIQHESRYFDGFIYPAVLPVPQALDQRLRFELDAPIATKTDLSKQYFAFGLSIASTTPGDLAATVAPISRGLPEFAARRTAVAQSKRIQLRSVPSLCGKARDSVEMRYMHGVTRANTGVQSWAAYSDLIDQQLAEGVGVFFTSCINNPRLDDVKAGKTLSNRESRKVRENHVVFLLPSKLIPSAGAELSITTRLSRTTRLAEKTSRSKKLRLPLSSPPLSLVLGRSPVYIASIGDSVAWGQGLRLSEKHLTTFADRLEMPTRTFMFAHSGAVTGFHRTNRPNIARAALQLNSNNDYCENARDFSGEVPRK